MVAKADNHTIDVRGIRDQVVVLLFQMAMQLVKTVFKFQLQQLILLMTMRKSGNEKEVTDELWDTDESELWGSCWNDVLCSTVTEYKAPASQNILDKTNLVFKLCNWLDKYLLNDILYNISLTLSSCLDLIICEIHCIKS